LPKFATKPLLGLMGGSGEQDAAAGVAFNAAAAAGLPGVAAAKLEAAKSAIQKIGFEWGVAGNFIPFVFLY
jgi:hypothetical protein